MEDLTWSLEREPYAHSPTKEEEEEDEVDEEEGKKEDEEEEEGEDEEEGDGDEGEDHGEGDNTVGQVDGGGRRPFILPLVWMGNDIYPTVSLKIFNNLHNRYQISEHIPLQLLGKFGKCYLGRTMDVGINNPMFTVGLGLPLMELHQ